MKKLFTYSILCAFIVSLLHIACADNVQNNQMHNIQYWEEHKDEYISLTDNLVDNILIIAESQIGYVADNTRYKLVDGEIKHWSLYGNFATDILKLYNTNWNYCHWCDAFASFCIYYSNNAPDDFPLEVSTQRHQKKLKELGYWREWSQYIPQKGDLVFFDLKNTHSVNHVGIIKEVIYSNPIKIITIEGNMNNENNPSCVKELVRDLSQVIGYGTYEKINLNSNTIDKLTYRNDNSTNENLKSNFYSPIPNKNILIEIGANKSIFAEYWFPGISKELFKYKFNELFEEITEKINN